MSEPRGELPRVTTKVHGVPKDLTDSINYFGSASQLLSLGISRESSGKTSPYAGRSFGNPRRPPDAEVSQKEIGFIRTYRSNGKRA
jgi:hypothetical protein